MSQSLELAVGRRGVNLWLVVIFVSMLNTQGQAHKKVEYQKPTCLSLKNLLREATQG